MVEMGGCIIKLPIEWNDGPSDKKSLWEVLLDIVDMITELIEFFFSPFY